ncbi:hypothetical protein GCM10010233_02380 [Streptomyces pseudogriseolus]|uniref:DUF3152 domain-containing protein n=1 Tax=Streptomyces pseudogriseolus TaxID=36817 RepID=A0ABQ2SKB6_STREZ|nr:DUF3152 domain-containing protein [Streptomyces rubiginosus]GGP90164.1 hypothetical protein GCM10010233_02380 [Streptomyces gancidicus]GGS32343.1 hypothetical protein GCM10010285_08670 [Streptomyces rubiginosus]
MGRHSRRGPAPKGDTPDTAGTRGTRDAPEAQTQTRYGDRRDTGRGAVPPQQQPQGTPPHGTPVHGYGAPGRGRPAQGVPVHGDGTPPRGVPQYGEGTPAHGFPQYADGTPAQGTPRYGDGTPAHGVPRYGDPAQAAPRRGDGAPAHGVPRYADGTPPHGVPRYADGTPAHGTPRVRGGHPEQPEAGGGWGTLYGRTAAAGAGYGAPAAGQGVPLPRQRQAPADGPRRDYVEAFDETDDLFTPRRPATRSQTDPYSAVTDWDSTPATGVPSDTDTDADAEPPTGVPAQTRGGKGRAFTGIAAAAVTTVLAVVVAGQVTDEHDSPGVQAQSAGQQARDVRDSASRGDDRATPEAPPARPLTYEQQMDRKFPLAATRGGTGTFYAVTGIDKAPGKGRKVTYRVDVEHGLALDGALFAEAVHRTLNDRRSWAHDGMTFERIESGKADFVITLAGPETTADWCAKSGLDTTEDNVSCDSAATERVLINAYRWAQGAETYGDKMFAYRQMLINHEIGHRLGHNHVTCDKDGDLAPVMQQQTKFLEYDGISCRPNPWPYPKG